LSPPAGVADADVSAGPGEIGKTCDMGAQLQTNDHTPVYDADAHICEPPEVWTEYCDPAYRDLIIRAGKTPEGRDVLYANGQPTGASAAPACIPGAYANPDITWDDIVPGSYDPAERIKVMDAEGLSAALMFPSLHLLSGDIQASDVAAANARAYNRWMADFVLENPDRLFGMGVAPLQSVDAAVAEIEFIAEHGLTGFTFRPERYNDLALFDPEMDRVWSAAEDHDLTIGIHGSFGSRMKSFARTRYDNAFYTHMVCHPFEQMACVMEVVASGILDDHPKLRVGFFESGLGWLPYWLDRLDEHKESMGHLVPRLQREPTEIWSEQCFVTMEAGEGEAFAQLDDMGLGHTVVWGSDYPHYDCTYPGALAELDDSFERVGRADRRDQVVYDNARRYMGLS
jgi:predicted TIM-barrel fold metal-dependent hydrolase